MTKLDPAVAAMIAAEDKTPPADKLDELKNLGVRLRDLTKEIVDTEERLTEKKTELNKIQFELFPNLFDESGTDRVGIPGAGNLPPCDVVVQPFYKANIEASWEESKRELGFKILEDDGAGDIIRLVVSVNFGKDQYEEATSLAVSLEKEGFEPKMQKSVPWNTLTSWVRERYEKQKRPLKADELEKLGAIVGRRAQLKERK